MNHIKFLFAAFVLITLYTSCTPREDELLREKYFNDARKPITKEELQKAIIISQPFENKDGVVEGDQYVVIKNNRPDIGGAWHLGWGDNSEKILGTDCDTIVYENNGTYNIYYMGISGNRIIQTDPITITVTNVFDKWMGFLTGAKDKADKNAQKKWVFRQVSWGSVTNMGAYGGWKYTSAGYTPESNFMWWNNATLQQAGNQSMIFKYDGNKVAVYDASGILKSEGTFSFTHNNPDQGVLGELVTSKPVIGSSWDDNGQNNTRNVFWILTFTDKYLTLFHPNVYTGGTDWGDYGWYVYYQAEN